MEVQELSSVPACARHLTPLPHHPVAKPCIGSMVTPGLAVLEVATVLSPQLAEEGDETATTPPVKDASWKLPLIGQNVFTWPYLAAREEGKFESLLLRKEK